MPEKVKSFFKKYSNEFFLKELRIQSRRMNSRFFDDAIGAFWAGTALLIYSKTNLPAHQIAQSLLEKFSTEVAQPNSAMPIFALLSYCICLTFNGWPPMYGVRKYIARPYLTFFFDICALATGAIIPALIAASTPDKFFVASVIFIINFLALYIFSTVIWLGIYLLSPRYEKISGAFKTQWFKHIPAMFGVGMLILIFINYKN